MNETYVIIRPSGKDTLLEKTVVFQKITSETEEKLFGDDVVIVNGGNSNYHEIDINKTILSLEIFILTSAYFIFLFLTVVKKNFTGEVKS
jgi:hypothetical protein